MCTDKKSDLQDVTRIAEFVANATAAIAYHRAAGVYSSDEKMQELGTAAVHLLTMATSYRAAQKK